MTIALYNWLILQRGQLPLRPGRRTDPDAEHRCTSVLVWPENADPSPDNTILVDPCFSPAGYAQAAEQLAALNITFADVGRLFVTHLHGDHMPNLPRDELAPTLNILRRSDLPRFPGLGLENCPGHDHGLAALTFSASDHRKIWIVGDAVLDEEWLRAWEYYWPNGYSALDVVEMWHSVAQIVAGADMIIPGHGPAIDVTADLVKNLLDTFPRAQYAEQCPDVMRVLRARYTELSEHGA